MKKSAMAYLRGGEIYLHPESKTTDGVWILQQPCQKFTFDISNKVLGEAIISALLASRENVPHPNSSQRKTLINPLLAAAGVRSWKAFSSGSECVSINQDGGNIVLIPMKNLGPKQGFVEQTDRSVNVPAENCSDIGSRVRTILSEIV